MFFIHIKIKTITTVVAGIFCASVGAVLVFFFLLSSPERAAGQELFVIPPHTTPNKAIGLLRKDGYVRNAKVFDLLLSLRGGVTFHPGGYFLAKNMNAWQVVSALQSPVEKWVSLRTGLSNQQIIEEFAKTLSWSAKDKELFRVTFAAMYWDFFNEDVLELFSQLFSWDRVETEKFATMSAVFSAPRFDFFKGVYVPADYLVRANESASSIVEKFLAKIAEQSANKKTFLQEKFDHDAAKAAQEYVRNQIEMLPDLIPLPASELGIRTDGRNILLTFDTTYWNEGIGPLELIADANTKGIAGDLDRNIYQRIYRVDGSHRDKLSGNFMWHDTHLHYHYADFIEYAIEPVGGQKLPSTTRQKSTFCVRDIAKVDVEIKHAAKIEQYTICGKERQGVSVGWGDTYFHTYPDQNINITSFEKGLYRLTFTVNPEHVFEELRSDNNVASVIIHLDPQKEKVELIDEITSNQVRN